MAAVQEEDSAVDQAVAAAEEATEDTEADITVAITVTVHTEEDFTAVEAAVSVDF